MSDDLISRKELLKKFIVSDNGIRIPEYDIDNFPVEIPIKDVKDIIRQLPASFDKEKVIEEIKEYSKTVPLYWNCNGGDLVNKIIDIIEKGGVE